MKKGDKIVCIDNTVSRNGIRNGEPKLEQGGFYTIKNIDEADPPYSNRISLEEIQYYEFPSSRFLTIKEWRKQKILKIKNSE